MIERSRNYIFISPLKGLLENGKDRERTENVQDCSELEEALGKVSQISTADHLAKNEIRLKISKDNYEEIKFAMKNGDGFFYIVINSANQSLVRAEPYISEPILY